MFYAVISKKIFYNYLLFVRLLNKSTYLRLLEISDKMKKLKKDLQKNLNTSENKLKKKAEKTIKKLKKMSLEKQLMAAYYELK